MNVDVSQLINVTQGIVIKSKVKQDILNAIGDVLLSLIKERAPNDTGEYVAGWRKQITSNSVRVWNRDRTLYVFLEFGTNPHLIEPNSGRALFFNGDFFANVTQSSRAFPHFRPAITRVKQIIPDIIKAKVALNSPVLSVLVADKYPEKRYIKGNNRGGNNNQRANTRVKGDQQ
uniref:Tail completion n=1 Tax=Nitrosopumivirus cobalaminus TaxID=3158414 RepID=A0AAU7N482_9VIRU